MMRSIARVGLLLVLGCLPAVGDTLEVFPPRVVLDGPNASRGVLVERRDGTHLVADATASATFAIDDPKVATVSEHGQIRPVGNGEATLTAKVGDAVATTSIVVRNFDHDPSWSFKNHVIPVLTRTGCNMGSCHGAAAGKNGFRLTLRGYGPEVDYDVLSRQALGRRIHKTAPAESLMLLKPTGAIEHGGGVRFATDSLEYRVLSEWIAAGMPAPRDDEPTLTRVTAYPSSVQFRPGQTQQILVEAEYSDGSVADVTRWSKFGSTDETVAKVDEDGRVMVEGRGETAITVWYSSLVDRATVSVPAEAAVEPGIYSNAPRLSPLDAINLAKLESLGIPPSPPSEDAAFLRRATLDATGTIPSRSQVEAFLQDPATDKRAQLVERLLASPEYVDYWTYKWSDLLLVSSKKLSSGATWAFSRAIRSAVAENLPWDAFARKIVTAKGSTLQNGEANYFVLHRDPIDLTESASMAFLGMSLTCARCHNHPMEKWTQDQYYGMANLFSRVALKDGGAGEVIVSSATDGDIVHPRKGVVMAPQPLDAAAAPISARGDRREQFADWLASPDNPYFDRAIVNRVWRNFLGRGLIEPEDDLRATNPPSDEALMTWLVDDFRAHNRDLKHLIRTIMTSAVYARSADPVPGNEGDTKFLSHYMVKRLPAEVLLDAIAKVSEVPETFPGYPAGWRSLQLPDAQVAQTFLTSFGRPERQTTCSCERSSEPSVAQALHLANGETVNQKLRNDQGVVARLVTAKTSDDEIVRQLFLSALGRSPSASEHAKFVGLLVEATAAPGSEAEVAAARRQAIEDLYWATLTSQEFLFNH